MAVGVRPSLPIPDVTFILGNDLAGGSVWSVSNDLRLSWYRSLLVLMIPCLGNLMFSLRAQLPAQNLWQTC